MNPCYPWLNAQWQILQQALQRQRVGHALLFSGPAGLGKRELAQQFAGQLLCAQQSACQQCHSCNLLKAHNHPDLITLAQADVIKVDAIRALTQQLVIAKHQDNARVAIIEAAETLTISAANALLKTLEEPQPGNYLIIVCNELSRLPATIISRCQMINFNEHSAKAEKVAYLQQHAAQLTAAQCEALWPRPLAVCADLDSGALQAQQALLSGLQTQSAEALCTAYKKWDFNVVCDWLLALVQQRVMQQPQKAAFALWDNLLEHKRASENNINIELALLCLFAQTQQLFRTEA